MIPCYKPYLSKYKTSPIDAINSEWISNHGKYIELATNKLKEVLGAKHVILMANGTVATHCLFMSLRHKYPHISKIYVPNNVYVAVYNCALMEYDLSNLEVLQINEQTWNMEDDEQYLLSLDTNSAIVIVHNVGGIIDVDRIKKIRPDIVLIEDNCEGLFGKYHGKYTGTSENILCSSVSFYGNKTITTGEGGAFITNNDDIYEHIKHIYSQGMSSKKFIHDAHAYNYRMTNVQAAFLYEQLNDLECILSLKKRVFNTYETLLQDEISRGEIAIQSVVPNCERANWIFAIYISKNDKTIDETNAYFVENGIDIRPFFYPYDRHNHLKTVANNSNDASVSEKLNNKIIMLPSYPELTLHQQEYIASKIITFVHRCNVHSDDVPL
jgi:perosamine synthetase